MAKRGKIIIFSAPSGAGKSTIISALRERGIPFVFSVSATSRPPRGEEKEGEHYYFLTPEEFEAKISAGEFLEYEEVYKGRYYGTLRSEVDRKVAAGLNVVLDIDVVGALNVKKIYGDEAKTIFIMPPSIEALEQRLSARATDEADKIAERVAKAEWEIGHAGGFDAVVVNDDLSTACNEAEEIFTRFIAS
ncbi:guanylate kinase [Porphyromonas sp. COT-108 OH1349]|uniref:guanylate kinase n=1 Tax=Porphyromonas sp. COT-108 OH1349 TaxID=1537504 RepID=UPI00052C0D87|nr:guanylate kinase [Porphyromonas sp. COT-108 OH1349]KGN69487.1 guanylate kinase [Porphyromonas sp. COT-108 OH1349]